MEDLVTIDNLTYEELDLIYLLRKLPHSEAKFLYRYLDKYCKDVLNYLNSKKNLTKLKKKKKK